MRSEYASCVHAHPTTQNRTWTAVGRARRPPGARFVAHGRVQPSGCCCCSPSAYELEALEFQARILPEGRECPAAPQHPGQSPLGLIGGVRLHRAPTPPGPDVGQHADEAVDFRGALAPRTEDQAAHGVVGAEFVFHWPGGSGGCPAALPVQGPRFVRILPGESPCATGDRLTPFPGRRVRRGPVMQHLELEQNLPLWPVQRQVEEEVRHQPLAFASRHVGCQRTAVLWHARGEQAVDLDPAARAHLFGVLEDAPLQGVVLGAPTVAGSGAVVKEAPWRSSTCLVSAMRWPTRGPHAGLGKPKYQVATSANSGLLK